MASAKAIACRVRPIARAAVFKAKAAVVAVVAMAEVANNMVTEGVYRAPECHGDPACAKPAASLAIRPRIARQTDQRVPPQPHLS
jgi:hypothetical protein